jgi:hypothetical protein
MRRALWMVAGSVIVSGACAAARSSDGPIGSAVDAALDAVGLGDSTAVSDAKAEDGPPRPLPPTVDDVACSTDGSWSGQPAWFAVKAYPGRSAVDLAQGSVLLCGSMLYPGGHCSVIGFGAKDGEATVMCGFKAAAGAGARTARFNMRPSAAARRQARRSSPRSRSRQRS